MRFSGIWSSWSSGIKLPGQLELLEVVLAGRGLRFGLGIATSAGNKRLARIAMMAMTTSSSIRVNSADELSPRTCREKK
jgi:hypothetical protein